MECLKNVTKAMHFLQEKKNSVSDTDAKKVTVEIDGKTLTTEVPGGDGPLDPIMSGWRYRTPTTQKLQMDDFEQFFAGGLKPLGKEASNVLTSAIGQMSL